MKKVYWRPRRVSRTGLLLIALISLAGLFVVEQFKAEVKQPHFSTKIAAARKARDAFDAIKEARLKAGPAINSVNDPLETGVVGLPMSPVTSVVGYLNAKQASVNPNFAAVVVDLLKKAGVGEGDVVALGVSGSFPALNACAFIGVEAIGAHPISIASVSASTWGANNPDLLWIDMEKVLVDEEVISTRSIAASIGGFDDMGQGLTDDGRSKILEAIDEHGLKLIKRSDFEKNVARRLEIYTKEAEGRPIKAFINVGGGAISVGRSVGKELFEPGLNLNPPKFVDRVTGVMPSLSQQGVPCIHLIHVTDLVERYALQLAPLQAPEIGKGSIFRAIDYNKPLVSFVLAMVIGSLYAFIRTDIGFRLLRGSGRSGGDGFPEPMV